MDAAWIPWAILVLLLLLLLPAGFLVGRWTAPTAEAEVGPESPGLIAEERETIYYCPMHPDQTSTDPDDRCPICGMALVARDDDDDDDDADLPRLRISERSLALMDIATWPAERRFVERSVRLYGLLDTDERQQKSIAAWIEGRVERLHVDFTGAVVERGEPMVELYSPPLISAQEELLQTIRSAQRLNASERGRESAERMLSASRERLRLLGLEPEQIAQIEERGEIQETVTIRAPIGGTVIERAISEGQYVSTGDLLYRVADLSRLWLQLEAYELDLPWLLTGQPVTLTTLSRPGELFEGEVTFVDPVLDRQKRTARVRVEVDNTGGRLKPGMFALGRARSTLDAEGRAVARPPENEVAPDAEPPLVIPRTAPLITGERAVAYVRIPEADRPTFEARQIVLGPGVDGYFVVREGLQEGDLVVTNGQFKIDSELQIRGRPSMMALQGIDGLTPGEPLVPPNHPALQIEPAEVDETFQIQLTGAFDAYIELVTALADDDFERSLAAVNEMHDRLLVLEHDLLEPTVHEAWQEVDNELHEALHAMFVAEDLDGIRDHLEQLSAFTELLVSRFAGERAGPVYRLHCPMAFDDAGADWLQRVEQVANPYFGAEMFRCGVVSETVVTDPDEVPSEDVDERAEPMETPDDFSARLAPVYDAYFTLQEALADDDMGRSRNALQVLLQAAEELETGDLSGPAAERWAELHEKLVLDADRALASQEIGVFREFFESWAEAAIELSRSFGHAEHQPHYVAHCPMAFDFQGADWLQRGRTINNPYFGAEMLRCGQITDEVSGQEVGAR